MHDDGLEWRALVLASMDPRDDSGMAEIASLLREPGFHAGEFIEQAMRQRLLYRVSAIVDTLPPKHPPTGVLRAHMREARVCNQLRMKMFREEAAAMGKLLLERKIAFAFTKGITLEATVYRGEGTRRMSDIDLMVPFAGREEIRRVMLRAGFTNGTFNRETGRLEPLDRKTHLAYELFPDHLPHFSKCTSNPATPLVTFDVSHSLTWHTSEWQIPLDEALGRTELSEVGGAMLPRLSWSYSFLFLVLHFFREAWHVEHMGEGHDVTLAKVADVHLTWKYHRNEIMEGGLPRIIREHSLERPVAWVLAHIDRTLRTGMTSELGLEAYADEAWLSTLRGESGETAICLAPMDARLRSRDRLSLVCETVPHA